MLIGYCEVDGRKQRRRDGTWLRLLDGRGRSGEYFDAIIITEAKQRVLAQAELEGWSDDRRIAFLGPTEVEPARSRITNDETYHRSCRRARVAEHVALSFQGNEGRVGGLWGRELRRPKVRRAEVARKKPAASEKW
jgi:hypothetical protein